MKNPLQDETAAFHLVLLSLVYFGLIVLGSWIDKWLGVAVFIVLTLAGLLALRGGRARAQRQRVARTAGGRRRVLVIANETVEGQELLSAVKARADGADVLVVCPALNSRVRTWTSDEDGAREAAQARLDASLRRLADANIRAEGRIGDGDPVLAVEDVVRQLAVDEIILSTHPPGKSNWLERGVVDTLRERFDVPVTHVIVDLEAVPASA